MIVTIVSDSADFENFIKLGLSDGFYWLSRALPVVELVIALLI
jgi:hypothetical protein